jgi:hypothetical protein
MLVRFATPDRRRPDFGRASFFLSGSVNVRGIQERYPEINGTVDGGDEFLLSSRTAKLAHLHATTPMLDTFSPGFPRVFLAIRSS